MSIVLTPFLPPVPAFIRGVTLTFRRPVPLRDSLPKIVLGRLTVFAFSYVVSLPNLHHHWRTYWPDTPLAHALGPVGAGDILRAALGQFTLSGPLFVGTFLATGVMRKGGAA